MVSYISVGELRRLQALSRYGEEGLPASYRASTAAKGEPQTTELPTSDMQKSLLRQKENIQVRSRRAFLRRERRSVARRAERALERPSVRDSSAGGRTALESEGTDHARAEARVLESLSELSSTTTTTSEEEEEEEDESVVVSEEKALKRETEEYATTTKEEYDKLQGELAYMREKVPRLLRGKRYEDAEGLLGYFLERCPRRSEVYFLSVQLRMSQRRYADAINMCWAGLFSAPGDQRFISSLAYAEELALEQACRIPNKYKAALFDFSSSSLQATRDKEEREVLRAKLLGSCRFIATKQNDRMCCIANSALETGDLVVKERPYIATPMLLFEDVLDPWGIPHSSKSDGSGSSSRPSVTTPPTSGDGQSHTMSSSTTRRRHMRLFTTCFHCLQERRIPDQGYACTVSPYSCPFVFCSWECLLRNGRIHETECAMLPFVFAAAKEAHISPTSVLHFFRFLIRAGLERDRNIAYIRAGAGSGGVAASSAPLPQTTAATPSPAQQQQIAQLDMLDRLFMLPSLRSSVELGQPELYYRICVLMHRVQKELHPRQYCFLKHEELVDAMLVLLQHSPMVVSGSAAALLSRRDPTAAVGLVFATAAAALPHSCIPTCCVDFSETDGEVSVRTICNVPAGGLLCISMLPDLFAPTSNRKQPQALPCVFACSCSRCSDQTEQNRCLRGIRCFACSRGYCNPNNSPSMMLRLRAYSTDRGTLIRRKFYWQKIWTEEQQKYMRESLANEQQPKLQGDQQAQGWQQRKRGGDDSKAAVSDDGEKDKEEISEIRKMLQQIDKGTPAAAQVFVHDDPYKILSKVTRAHKRQSRAEALDTALQAVHKAAAVSPDGRVGVSTVVAKAKKEGLTGKGKTVSASTTKELGGGLWFSARTRPSSSTTAAPSSSSASSTVLPLFFSPSLPGEKSSATSEQETWQCNFCGCASSLLSAQCRAIEQRVSLLGAAATAALERGKPLAARLILQVLIDRYSVVLHPYHWRLYDAHIVIAGLYLSQPQQQLQQALASVRLATIAADAVLPICSREKVPLYTKMAELQFMHMQQRKIHNRAALSPSADTVLEPLYAALHNAVVCCGKNSVLALTCMHRVRIYAGALCKTTPPLSFTLRLRPIPIFLKFYRNLFRGAAGSDEVRGVTHQCKQANIRGKHEETLNRTTSSRLSAPAAAVVGASS